MAGEIKVMIVDDHDMVRRGLATLMQVFDDLILVGEAADGADAVQRCAELHPDVILMDVVMPEVDGITATRAIRAAHPEINVIILTSFAKNGMEQTVREAGAVGCLSKNASIDELAASIRYAAHMAGGIA